MPTQDILDFVQIELQSGKTNEAIVESLRDEKQTSTSARTLRRWIAKHQLARPIPSTAMNRAPLWITDVRGLIRRGIPFKDILHHLHKQYNENISLRTLEFVLNQVIWGFHWFVFYFCF